MPESAFAFVLGTGRCGSTLVHEVLARHPDVGFVSNVEDGLPWLPLAGRWNNELYRRVPPRFTRKGRIRFAPSEGYRILDRRVSPALSAPCRDLTAEDVTPWLEFRFRRFFEDRARAQGRPVFLHKFTGWPRAGFIHRVMPDAKFVHVIRDGRAVANSLLQMPWWRGYRGPTELSFGRLPEAYAREWEAADRSFAVLAGLEWKLLMDAFEEARSRIPEGQWVDVRYEDFVADPRTSMEGILRFLGLGWSREFEAGFAGYTFSAARQEAYRRDLAPRDVKLLEDVLAGHLERYGYATPGNPPGSGRRTSTGEAWVVPLPQSSRPRRMGRGSGQE